MTTPASSTGTMASMLVVAARSTRVAAAATGSEQSILTKRSTAEQGEILFGRNGYLDTQGLGRLDEIGDAIAGGGND